MEKIKTGEVPKGHMGHQFIHWLTHYQGEITEPNPDFGCCYIMPPIGGYMSHDTTWMKEGNAATLRSHWQAKWIQEGIRTQPLKGRSETRVFCHFRAKGHAAPICRVIVPLPEDQWWRTLAPENMPKEYLGVQVYHRPKVIEDLVEIIACSSAPSQKLSPSPCSFLSLFSRFKFEFEISLM